MDVSDVDAVLNFLRRNGLTEAETALKEDMVERSQVGAFDFESFVFPLPPPVRIPSILKRSVSEERGKLGSVFDSDGDEDDEFVSLGSSVTASDHRSSEFVNPYGLHSASLANSDTSSDRLSQFGTAREYLQNDHYWYEEKDEDDFLTPCFDGSDFFGRPSEDKFVTTSEQEKHFDNLLSLNHKSEAFPAEACIAYLDKPCVFKMATINGESYLQVLDSHYYDKSSLLDRGIEKEMRSCSDYGCSLHLDGCSEGAGGFCDQDPVNFSYVSSKETCLDDLHLNSGLNSHSVEKGSEYECVEEFKAGSDFPCKNAEADFLTNIVTSYGVEDTKENRKLDEPKAAANEEVNDDDELAMYNTKEDEYEVFNLRIYHRKNRTGFEENKEFAIMLNTVIAGRYFVMEYLGSAAFSKVVQAQDLHTGMDVCLKIIKNDKDFFDQSLDEIKLLKLVNKHDPADEHHILRLYDYFYYQEHLFIVCELLRANLYEFQKFNQESGGEAYFTLSRLQIITRQCLEALDYLHDLGIVHCDLKPENILIKSYRRCEIKIIDLGSSCFQTDNLCLYVQSRSYRAPEVILGLPYDQKIDLWSLGCILAELYSGEVLFPNDAVVMILARMIGLLGPIDQEMLVKGQETHKYFTEEYDLYYLNEETNQLECLIPEESALEHHLQVSDARFIDFIRHLLEINPQRRLTARKALQHPWLSHPY
ncbi:hypothetical protein SLE2022_107730 [Rubroshorea leprosula]